VCLGFQLLLRLTRQVLAAYIFKDIEDVFAKLYTRDWVDRGEQVEEIKGTLEDYFGSVIRGHLLENYFKKFVRLLFHQRKTAVTNDQYYRHWNVWRN